MAAFRFFSKSNIVAGLLLVAVVACHSEKESAESYQLNVPQGFPKPPIPEKNQLTKLRIDLGRELFFDPILSRDSTVSCASCHHPEKAFSDIEALSRGVDDSLGMRNAPALVNVVYGKSFFRDGGVPTLEQQILVPFDDHREFDLNMLYAVERLERHPRYSKMSKEAYGRGPDPFTLTRSLAAFERTLISGNSPYDQFTYQGKQDALTASEKRGLALFEGDKLQCRGCHAGFNFTNELYENNGLKAVYADTGRARITSKPEDVGKFKVPTLRNVELTGPYMHDGSVKSLAAVVEHYQSGGAGHVNQSQLIAGFELNEQEKRDLINFLKSLTDTSFVANKNHQHPADYSPIFP